MLTPIWAGKPALARRLRGWIRTALEWAQGHGYVDLNVAGEAINGALPKTQAVRAHHPALPYTEVGAALTAIADSGAGACATARSGTTPGGIRRWRRAGSAGALMPVRPR